MEKLQSDNRVIVEQDCKRCGDCCSMVTVPFCIPDEFDVDDYLDCLYGFEYQLKLLASDDGELFLEINGLKCKHLEFINEDVAKCKIYDERPKICRDFRCKKSIKIK